jgi:hypothetical protein
MFAAKASMNIDMAGSQMLQQVDHHSHKCNVNMANGIQRHKHWSKSLTRDTLMSYKEGLAVKNFDSCDKYVVLRKDEKLWKVVTKMAIDDVTTDGKTLEGEKSPITRYHRVRNVSIDSEGFMACTCPYGYNYLAPCRHVMAVLGTSDNVVPSLFHIRWWEVFNYYFLTDFGKENVANVHTSLDNAYQSIMMTQFNSDRVYKGCHVHECIISDFTNSCDDDTVGVIDAMSAHIDKKGVI